jgi:hypothetical protein
MRIPVRPTFSRDRTHFSKEELHSTSSEQIQSVNGRNG